MADNPFDQFDGGNASPQSGGNAFDQFDSGSNGVGVHSRQSNDSGQPSAPNLSWGDVGVQALENAPSSFMKTGEAMMSPIMHPVDTLSAIYHTTLGAAEKAIPGQQADEKYVDALGHYIGSRYGSVDNFKRAIATDPVGVATDLSVPLTGGGSALAKAPGLLGKIGDAMKAAGTVGNPMIAAPAATKLAADAASKIPGVARVASALSPGNVASSIIGDITTGAGANAIKTAYNAGRQGGDAATAFTGNMRGSIPWNQVVDDAKGALANMRASRGAAYRAGMASVSGDQSVLDFKPIDDALENINEINSYKGQDLSPKTTGVREEINSAVANWKSLDPAEYHTPEGFDALKQKIGDIKDAQPFGSPQRTMANTAYNAIRGTIADQAPVYDKVMKGYSDASDQLSELQKELSLGPKGNPNTALRKLQSVMRDNVNTSFGNRTKQAGVLAANGAPDLMPALAGQALSTVIPRGLAKYGDLAGIGAAGLANIPGAIGMAAISSPRLMGEAAYGLGSARRLAAAPLAALSPLATAARNAAPISYEVAAPRQATLGDLQPQGYGSAGAGSLWAAPAFSGAQ